jgi:glycosyltransferase involved in cell wall biosynthesis
MKIKIIITVFDMEIGGIERSLINMLESFDYEKYEVDLFICNHVGDFLSLIPAKVNVLPESPGYTVFRKPIVQCIKEGHYTTSIIRILCKAIAMLKSKFRNLKEGSGYIQMQLALKYVTYVLPQQKKSYDLAISYAWPHDLAANKVVAAKKIAWIHTDYSELEIDNKLDLNVWNKFDNIASISDACTEAFLKKYPSLKNKIIQIENITSPMFIKKMADCDIDFIKQNNQSFHIVSVGRLSYVKGFDLAVKALRLLHDKGLTRIKWLIVGYGGFESELKGIIAENKMQDSFILLGKKTNPYPYIKSCDLYVQPSRYEGKAVTVTEAKILGKPILITNYPTAGSQINNKIDGVICDLSVEGIADGIERFYKDSELRRQLAATCENTDYSNSYELNKLYKIL